MGPVIVAGEFLMTENQKTRNKFTNSFYIDLGLEISDRNILSLIDILSEQAQSAQPKRVRSRTKKQLARVIHALVANLIKARWTNVDYVAVSLNKNNYHSSSQHGIGYQALTKAMGYLTNPIWIGAVCLPPFLLHYPGYQSPDGFRDNSKLSLNEDFLRVCAQSIGISIEGGEPRNSDSSLKILLNREDRDKDNRITPITKSLNSVFRSKSNSSLIRLKGIDGLPVQFDRTPETDRMTELLRRYNECLANSRVELGLPED